MAEARGSRDEVGGARPGEAAARSRRLARVGEDGMRVGPSSPNATRQIVFDAGEVTIVRSRTTPDVATGWHHHGEHDVFGYVVSGIARFEAGPGGKDVIEVAAGEFFHVPARLVHRDVNPSKTQGQEMVLTLRGGGPLVVNVEGPEPE